MMGEKIRGEKLKRGLETPLKGEKEGSVKKKLFLRYFNLTRLLKGNIDLMLSYFRKIDCDS